MQSLQFLHNLTEFMMNDKSGEIAPYFLQAMEITLDDVLIENDYVDDEGGPDIEAAEEDLTEEVVSVIQDISFDYFCTASYPDEKSDKTWNFIDYYLKSEKDKLSKDDIDFCQALRDSYLSLYEVTDITADGDLTLKGLVKQYKKKSVTAKQMATIPVETGAVIAARILTVEDENWVLPFYFGFENEDAKLIADQLAEMTEGILASPDENMFADLKGGNQMLAVQKLWTTVILSTWVDIMVEELDEADEMIEANQN